MLDFLRALGKSEHKRIQEQLSAYLDGELSPRDRTAVERHLQTCGECARNLATLRWTVSLVQEVPAAALPRSFIVRPAAVEAVRAPRRTGLAFTYLRGATALAAVLLVLVLSADAVSLLFTGGAAPVPQVVEREVLVEKAVVETVVVEKEVERAVVATVVVEAEKVVEKAVELEVAKAVEPPPTEGATTAQKGIAAEEAAPKPQPTASPPIKTAGRVLATKDVEQKLEKEDVGAAPQGTPAPPAAAVEAPVEAAPAATPTVEASGARQPPTDTAPTPTAAPTEVALELSEPSPEPSMAERRAITVPSERGLGLWRQLEIGLLVAVVVLGAATLIARRGR